MKLIRSESGLTVTELKELIRDWPETDQNGEPCEVWLGNGEGTSNVAVEAGPLNYRVAGNEQWVDLYIGHRPLSQVQIFGDSVKEKRDMEERCSNCRWFKPTGSEDFGWCVCPLPEWVVVGHDNLISGSDGSGCSTFEERRPKSDLRKQQESMASSGDNARGQAPVFGYSVVSRPEYRREQERLNREFLERAENVHVRPMIKFSQDVRETTASLVSKKLTERRELLIMEALEQAPGHGGWCLNIASSNRLVFEHTAGIIRVMFDGKPLLTFYPPEFSIDDDAEKVTLTAVQKYRRHKQGNDSS